MFHSMRQSNYSLVQFIDHFDVPHHSHFQGIKFTSVHSAHWWDTGPVSQGHQYHGGGGWGAARRGAGRTLAWDSADGTVFIVRLLSLYFLNEIQLIYNAVVVSGVQSDSVLHIYNFLFHILFHYSLLQGIE